MNDAIHVEQPREAAQHEIYTICFLKLHYLFSRLYIERDYETFSGLALEKYFRTLFIEQENYTRIGGFWDRRGENEIDLIAINEFDKTANIVEIKRQKKNIDMERLREKGIVFKTTAGLYDYQIIYQGLSMEDM